MNGKQLKNSILQWAIQGKLVPQDPNDEPASVLLDKIRQEKERLIKEKKIKRDKNASIIYRGEDNSYYEKILATGEVKCIDEEIPFDVPQGWEWCRLGEISTYAQTKRKINASNADSQLWGLDLEDIEKGGRLLNIKTVGERKAIGDKTMFNRGDILYSKLRPYLLKILVAPEEGICTPEIIPFTCYGNICKDYIVSFLKSPYVDGYINSVTFGVKMPRVSTETMISLLVPLPPLSEQFRIDTRTKELMPYIDRYGKAQNKLNKLNEALSNTIRKSILQEAIQGKLVPQIAEEGTAQELLERIKAEKQKLVKEGKLKKSALNDSVIFKGDDNKYWEKSGNNIVCIDEEIPFGIPPSWSWCRLGNIASVKGGKRIPVGEKLTTENTGHMYIRVADMKENTVKTDDIHYISESIYQKIKSYTISTEDLYITVAGTIGSVGEIPKVFDNANLTENADKIVFRGICKKFLMYCLLSNFVQSQIKKCTTKVGQPKLAIVRIEDLLIPLPPIKEQYRIVHKIEQTASIMSK